MSEKLSSGQKARSKVHSFDDLFNTSTDMGFGQSVQNEKYHVEEINLSEMHEFPNHPFPVVDDDEMAELVASIEEHGILQAAVVRKDPSGGYQIISGHRRHMACMKLGYEKMPVVIVEMDDEDATTCMVDANFSQRKEIPISCKVRAYRQKFDAQKKKGKITATYDELGEAAGESGKTVQRMLRLSYLSDELLDLMDVGKLGVVQGVSISYLDEDDQQLVLVAIEDTQVNMNKDQAQKIRELGESKSLNLEVIRMLLTDKKKKERKYTMKSDIISRYFEEDATDDDIEQVIVMLLEKWKEGVRNG